MRAWLVQAAAPLAVAALLLTAVVMLGRLAAEDLRARRRYAAAFADVRCAPPAPLRREEFLREVQYEAELPDHLDRLDAGLPVALRDAFLRHPWVEGVERVGVPASGPIYVRLRFRTPALAVAEP